MTFHACTNRCCVLWIVMKGLSSHIHCTYCTFYQSQSRMQLHLPGLPIELIGNIFHSA